MTIMPCFFLPAFVTHHSLTKNYQQWNGFKERSWREVDSSLTSISGHKGESTSSLVIQSEGTGYCLADTANFKWQNLLTLSIAASFFWSINKITAQLNLYLGILWFNPIALKTAKIPGCNRFKFSNSWFFLLVTALCRLDCTCWLTNLAHIPVIKAQIPVP